MKKNTPRAPEGYNTVNPFIITKEAPQLIKFLEKVFDARENKQAYTLDTDGLILHAELEIGDAIVMIADRKKDWPFTPSLLQVYVDKIEDTLERAEKLGAKIITKPSDFFGAKLSRFQDPWGNLWWVYEHGEQVSWEGSASDDASWSSESNEQLDYIHSTLLEAMKNLGKK